MQISWNPLFIKHCKTTKFLLFQKVYQVKLADLHYLCPLFQTLNHHDERILSTDAALCGTVQKVLGMVNTTERIVRCFQYFFFSLLIPILNILFKTGENRSVYQLMEWGSADFKEVATNNFYYYTTQLIDSFGPATTLLFLGLFLAGMTLLKTACYFGSSAIMIPLRTG